MSEIRRSTSRSARPGVLMALSVTLAGCAAVGGPAPPTPEEAAMTITASEVAAHIAFLASDAMRGRDTPSPELEEAARYLAAQFDSMGLEPGGDGGTFIQRFPWVRSRLDPERVVLRLEGSEEGLELARDFFLVTGQMPIATGPVFYAGSMDADLTSFEEAMRGAVVLFEAPGAELDGAWQQRLMGGMGRGARAGAAAVGFLLDPEFPPRLVRGIAGMAGGQRAPIPLFGVLPGPAGEMLAAAGTDLAELQATGDPGPVPDAVIEVGGEVESEEIRPPNVVAILPGSDSTLKHTYVIYSAHFDHVGVGSPDADGDSIYNGADDDASGTVALLEVAEAMAAMPRPARSQVFLAVSGEEKGLLGSAYYADNPTVPDSGIVANINLDMIGRNAPDSVIAIGQEYTTLGPLTHRVAETHPDLGLVVAPDMMPEERFFFRSDHFSFARNGVPAIFFTTGLHDQYHRPSDEPELIDDDKLARIARLVFYLGHAIATDPEPPEWTEEGWAEVERMIRGSRRP